MRISRKLYNRLQAAGLRVTDNYSGRFMYGKMCFGVTVSQLATALYDLSEALHEITAGHDDPDLVKEASDMLKEGDLKEFRTDNMGLDYIIYFPHITVEKENE